VTSAAIQIDQLYFTPPGGIGTYVRNLVPALAAQDPSLDIALFHARFGRGQQPPERWVRDFWVEELPASIRSLYPRWNLLAMPRMPSSLRSKEVLHATSPAAIPPKSGDQRLVVTVHDLAFEEFPAAFNRKWRTMFRQGLRAAVRRADAIVTPSRNTAEDLLSNTDVDPTRVHVVPLAASLEASSADPEPVLERLGISRPYVLFVGTLEKRKNLLRLVRAYRRLAATGAPHSLVLAGAMGFRSDEILREIALEGPGHVIRTGELPADELDAVLRSASVFAYPSVYEGFGLPVLEAMVRGIPTVCSNTSSLPEVVGDAALTVDPKSVSEISEALAHLVSDHALAEKLSEKARARAERFSWAETARRTLEVYQKAGAE
jgi:glycosyltransferase involved in cell wall biosynthesis